MTYELPGSWTEDHPDHVRVLVSSGFKRLQFAMENGHRNS